MQEEIERQTISLVFKAARLSTDTLAQAMRRAMDFGLREIGTITANELNSGTNKTSPTGKMSLKELIGKGSSPDRIQIEKEGMKTFQKTASKFGVDYAVYKEPLKDHQNKYYVFFQAKDTRVIRAAFEEYTKKNEQRKQSLQKRLEKKQEIVNKKKERQSARRMEKQRNRESR